MPTTLYFYVNSGNKCVYLVPDAQDKPSEDGALLQTSLARTPINTKDPLHVLAHRNPIQEVLHPGSAPVPNDLVPPS